MIAVSVVTLVDNLQPLVDEINRAAWDHANEMSEYDVVALSAYLERQDMVFVACHDVTDDGRTLLGMASARVELKPYGNERWLYVDEVDVCADQRRRGAGKAIMRPEKLQSGADSLALNCERNAPSSPAPILLRYST